MIISSFLNGGNYLSDPQFSSVSQSCPTLCDTMDCSTSGLPVHHQLPEFTQTHVHWVSDAIQPSHLMSSPSPPTFNLSQRQGLFKWVSSSHQVAKVLGFQLQHQSFEGNSGLISFRMDQLDLLVVQGTLESSPTPQFKSINSSVLSFLYSPTLTCIHDHRKTIALTRRTFVDKVMSPFFNMLSRLIITFLPRSKCLLISWLQSPSAVILEPRSMWIDRIPLAILWILITSILQESRLRLRSR